jgi:phosphotriesterase-related protein
MMRIQTVLGPIAVDDLGPTSMHEHVLTDNAVALSRRGKAAADKSVAERELFTQPLGLPVLGALQLDPVAVAANLDLDDDDVAVAELAEFRAAGGRAVVEVSAVGSKVDVRRIAAVSRASGVSIVMATGFYTSDFWPESYLTWTVDQFAAFMLNDFQRGIDGSGILAGHIKCGVGNLNEPERCVLLAAAQVAQQTGSSITVHPGREAGRDGREIGRILTGEGMQPDRVVIAHADTFLGERSLRKLLADRSGWRLALDYHREVLAQGCLLGFDTFGQTWSSAPAGLADQSDYRRLAGVAALVEEGYGNQIVLGTDTFMPMLTRRGGGQGYRHLFTFVLPQLHEAGVPEQTLDQMTRHTPRRLLALPM